MAVFRIQEHSPDVYPRKSRDYQLFSVIFDCLNGGLKYDIDSIRDVIDTNQCNERLIPYLQTKLGFFTKLKIPTNKLRIILKAFPEIVKHKGSLKGIRQAVEVFIKVEKIDANIEVSIDNIRRSVIIGTTTKINDFSILKEILRYVLPAGYMLEFLFRVKDGFVDSISYSDTVRLVSANESLNAGVRLNFDPSESKKLEELENMPNIINDVGTSMITNRGVLPTDDVKNNYKKYGREDLWNLKD